MAVGVTGSVWSHQITKSNQRLDVAYLSGHRRTCSLAVKLYAVQFVKPCEVCVCVEFGAILKKVELTHTQLY